MALPVRTLALALLAVVCGFVGSTLWSQRVSHSIDDDALLISRDAAPALQYIADARAQLRDLQAKVGRSVVGRETIQLDYDVERAKVTALIRQAMDLPTDPHETAFYVGLHAGLRSFDEAAHLALEEYRSGQHAAARATMDSKLIPAGDETSQVAKSLVDYEAQAVASAAVRIEDARNRSDRVAYELDALCVMLSICAAILVMRILRQMQRAEREKRQLMERKAEELEQFAGRVAHDILSPLSAVSMAVAIVEKRAPQEQEVLSRAGKSLHRVHGIVDGLLGFARAGARPEAGARAEVQPVVAGLLEELLPAAEHVGATLVATDVPCVAVECSPGVLLSLLGNLLRNSLKYLGESRTRQVTLRVKARRGRVLFEVEDTGPGIPSHLLQRVFEPYVRGPNVGAPGIGLGLATVKRLVESHGGTVGLRSAPQHGCVFWFELDESFPPEPSLDAGDKARIQSA
jgi:signal transduction histidine kinase